MPVIARHLKRMLLVAICAAWIVPWAMLARGQDAEIQVAEEDIDLVEHSGEIFVGTIDIVTAVYEVEVGSGPEVVTEYTVLVDEVLKGDLSVPMIVVARQNGGDPLIPGSRYLLFVRFLPGELRYEIVGPDTGIIPLLSDDDRQRLIGYWSEAIVRTVCQHTDILKLDGVIYARRGWNDDKRHVDRDLVGPTVATVSFQDTTATGCRDDLADGIASELPMGTKVQRLDGYEPSFRVAIRKRDGHRYLYEAIRSETAKTGADLLDIDDRVTSLTVTPQPFAVECHDDAFCFGPPECDDGAICDYPEAPAITDQAFIAQVLTILNSSPADPERTNWRSQPPERLHLEFMLDDGSRVTVQISLRTGLTPGGIEVPVAELMELLGIE